MEYEKIYLDYFERFCKLFEYKMKRYFIENKLNCRTFSFTEKLINDYSLKYINKYMNEHPYISFYDIFRKRNNDYSEKPIQNIFKNELKSAFETSSLRTERKFNWLIKKIAFSEAIRYISNQFRINIELLENVFETQNFENFENILKSEIIEDYFEKTQNTENELSKINELTTRQKILLIENLILTNRWSSYSERKKAELISYLINRNETNIRNILALSDKKISEQTKDFIKDTTFIKTLIE